MNVPPAVAQALLGLVRQAAERKLDGIGSSAFQSLAAGVGDFLDERQKRELKSYLTGARGEVQAAHDDFRQAARGKPAR